MLVLVVDCVYHIRPGSFLAEDALRLTVALTAVDGRQVLGRNHVQQLLRARLARDQYFRSCVRVELRSYFCQVVILEHHGCIQYNNAVDNFGKLPAQVSHKRSENGVTVLIRQLLQRRPLEVDHKADLVHNSAGHLHALVKLLSPRVLHLLEEKLGNHIRCRRLEQLRLLELTELEIKDGSAVAVDLVEARGHELLDGLVLQEVVLEDEVDLVDLSPLYPGLQLAQRVAVIELLAEKEARVDAVLEDHLVDVVEDLGVVDLFDELVQRRHLLSA